MVTFRNLLRQYEDEGRTDLYSAYNRMYAEALSSWLPQLGAAEGAHQGIPHIANVEAHIEAAIPEGVKKNLIPTELFLLLASILLHDIGKIRAEGENDAPTKGHAKLSCLEIQEQWPYLRIPRRRLAKWCAILACSHAWKTPKPPSGCEFRAGNGCDFHCEPGRFSDLSLTPDTEEGRVRLAWIASLLRLGDEVDNKETRAIVHWLREVPVRRCDAEDKENARKTHGAKEWRGQIQWIDFDAVGQCIRFRCTESQLDEIKRQEKLDSLKRAVHKTNLVLRGWSRPFLEMGLRYRETLLDVQAPDSVLKKLPSGFGEGDMLPDFEVALEPSLSKDLLRRISAAMTRLDRGVIGNQSFTWVALAEEAGIDDAEVVKLGARRLRAISLAPGPYGGEWRELVDGTSIICSTDTWQLERGQANDLPLRDEDATCEYEPPKVISTGLVELDKLLCPDDPGAAQDEADQEPEWPGGFYCPSGGVGETSQRWFSPIIMIEGPSGMGKTILSLQIACNLARRTSEGGTGAQETTLPERWLCLYYSLEQEPSRLQKSLSAFRGFAGHEDVAAYKLNDHLLDFNVTPWYEVGPDGYDLGKLLFPNLSPVSWSASDPDHAFKTRYQELMQAIQWAQVLRKRLNKNHADKRWHCFFVVDSLNAFSSAALTRNQIHMLFSAFRYAGMPLLVTHERREGDSRERAEPYSHHARYLADIGITLESHDIDHYSRQTIEVVKSRFSRRILGKHQFKLKSYSHQTTKGFDNRCGVVIYPSIHYRLSQVRERAGRTRSDKKWKIIFDEERLRIGSGGEEQPGGIDSDSCLVVSGPHGGHKFAIALNLLLCCPREPARRKLIISMSEEKDINLRGAAMFEQVREHWGHYLTRLGPGGGLSSEKIQRLDYGVQGGDPTITVINFRMGQIMPEELLYILEKFLDRENKEDGKDFTGYDAILFTDTAQLRTRFPGLAPDSLFLPALVDIIKTKGLYSVFNDVEDEYGRATPALLAAADCRIFVEHHKDEGIRMHVNNVRGKIYEAKPLKVEVTPGEDGPLLELHSPSEKA